MSVLRAYVADDCLRWLTVADDRFHGGRLRPVAYVTVAYGCLRGEQSLTIAADGALPMLDAAERKVPIHVYPSQATLDAAGFDAVVTEVIADSART